MPNSACLNINSSNVSVFRLFLGHVFILLTAEKPRSQSAVAMGRTSPRESSSDIIGKICRLPEKIEQFQTVP